MAQPDLIIFDCDGVLIDSEAIACRTDSACLAEIGIAMSAEDIMERYVGISTETMLADIAQCQGKPLPADFPQTLRERIAAAFETELRRSRVSSRCCGHCRSADAWHRAAPRRACSIRCR
jgi:beta-phosphoglucomutase-like phosphatase (HAD superfamily)